MDEVSGGPSAHGIDEAEELIGRLALVALDEEEGAALGGRSAAVHDLV